MSATTQEEKTQYISDVMARRAATLWMRLLEDPQYKATNEHDSPEDRRNLGVAAAITRTIPTNKTTALLEAFGEALFRRIKCHGSPRLWLSVDYGPDAMLDDSAKEVGLDIQFPWKTNMAIDERCVSLSAGYGAEHLNHYPLSDGRWLITGLRGGDIGRIIDAVERGIDIGLTIEAAN